MPDACRRMRVLKYIPNRMFGFLGDDGKQVFFHLRVFHPGPDPAPGSGCGNCAKQVCDWAAFAPPPIMGELVEAVVETDPERAGSLRAAHVERVVPAVPLSGTIDTFDIPRGYGFIKGTDGHMYYVHRSEIIDRRIPVIGQKVMFYVAERKEKARACHIKLCQERT